MYPINLGPGLVIINNQSLPVSFSAGLPFFHALIYNISYDLHLAELALPPRGGPKELGQ